MDQESDRWRRWQTAPPATDAVPRRHLAPIFSVVLLALLPLCIACNSLFYYPQPDEAFSPAGLGLPFSSSFVTADDGVKLHVWTIAARGVRRGTVLQFHGNGENMSTHFLFVAWLADYGYDVITFDYRGYGKSGGQPDRTGIARDATAVIAYAARRGGDLFIIAQSLGGAVAVPALAEAPPPRLRGLILDSTFASYRGMARAKLAEHWITWILQGPLGFLVSDDLNPVDAAPMVKVPTISVHDPNDPVVPYHQGELVFAAIGAKEKEFWPFPGGGTHIGAFAYDPVDQPMAAPAPGSEKQRDRTGNVIAIAPKNPRAGPPKNPWKRRLLEFLGQHATPAP